MSKYDFRRVRTQKGEITERCGGDDTLLLVMIDDSMTISVNNLMVINVKYGRIYV